MDPIQLIAGAAGVLVSGALLWDASTDFGAVGALGEDPKCNTPEGRRWRGQLFSAAMFKTALAWVLAIAAGAVLF